MLPPINKNANVRVDWCRELDDGTEEEFIVDGYLNPSEEDYLNQEWESSYIGTGTEVYLVGMYKKIKNNFVLFNTDSLNGSELNQINDLLIQTFDEDREADYYDWIDNQNDEFKNQGYDDYLEEDHAEITDIYKDY